ncbi:MAG: hypothetical protein ACRDTC_09395, partial [Pseudonocardiaceae bacterium]
MVGKSLVGVILVLAAQAGDGGYEPSAKACQIDTRGIRVVDGMVTDVVIVTCNPPPSTHRLDRWIEYRPDVGEQWRRVSAKKPTTVALTRPTYGCRSVRD